MRVFDDIFDKRYLDELIHKLTKTSWCPNNIANRSTWPYGDKGTHRFLGTTFFNRHNIDLIEYRDLKLSTELIDIFYAINRKTEKKLLLQLIEANLQFMGMDGTNHIDMNNPNDKENEVVYIMMLSDEYIETDGGGQFINETVGQEVEFKHGRVIEMSSTDLHRGLAFNIPYKPRYSLKFLGTENLKLEMRESI